MGIFLPEAYALGLLAQLGRQQAALQAVLSGAAARAAALQAPVTAATESLAAAQAAERQRLQGANKAATELADQNAKIASLSREVAALQRRVDGLTEAVGQAAEVSAQLALREQRGPLLVQLGVRQKRLSTAQAAAAAARQVLVSARQAAAGSADRLGALQLELQRLQAELPRPVTTMKLGEVLLAQAHCQFVVDQDPLAWQQRLSEASGPVVALHLALRGGRYPREGNAEVLGGRAHATVQVLQAMICRQQWRSARELFEVATQPQWFFHHIFNVFVSWCFGLYLTEERRQLGELLALHEFAQGLRGAYARAFLGLLQADSKMFERALRKQIQLEWEAWRRLPQKGLGVVNLGALALCQLADATQLRWNDRDLGPTVPQALRT